MFLHLTAADFSFFTLKITLWGEKISKNNVTTLTAGINKLWPFHKPKAKSHIYSLKQALLNMYLTYNYFS